jgi:hypothetical protein
MRLDVARIWPPVTFSLRGSAATIIMDYLRGLSPLQVHLEGNLLQVLHI